MQVPIGNGKFRAKELGYFIAKILDEHMEVYLQRFNELYKEKTSIDIEIIDDFPLSIKYSRANKSGEVCYCKYGTNEAYKKTSNGWESIKCEGAECEYRQDDHPDCKKVAWFKFLIPKIATDRIWLMKITSKQAINTLNDYFKLRKQQGQSIKGKYILFLKKVENSKDGKTFNNTIVDIMEDINFVSNNQIPAQTEHTQTLPTANNQNVNNTVPNTEKEKSKEQTKPQNKVQSKEQTESKVTEQAKETSKKKDTTKENKQKSKKETTKKIEKIAVEENPDVDKCYYFTNHHTEQFKKDGVLKEYFIGEFYDMTDKQVNFIVKPELVDVILECGIGSVFEAEVQEFKGKKILTDIKFVQNNEKNIAA